MSKAFKKYANQVLTMLNATPAAKRRIREDILEALQDRFEDTGITDPVELLGDPKSFAENLGEEMNAYPSQYRTRQSETTILGLPLYMFSNNPTVTSKAWIAIGTKAVGFISIGAFSIGILSFGAFSMGVFGFGGIAIALLSSFGGVSIAYDTAIGGIAIANHLAMGGLALSKEIAIGGMTTARLMAYTQNYIPLSTTGLTKSHWAFKIPEELGNFRELFNRHYDDFGMVKRAIVEGILRIR